MTDLGNAGEWPSAKIIWLTKGAKLRLPKQRVWNIHGGENELFVRHLGDLHASEQISTCDSPECLKPQFLHKDTEINLRYVLQLFIMK
jgi:hypothetical protein